MLFDSHTFGLMTCSFVCYFVCVWHARFHITRKCAVDCSAIGIYWGSFAWSKRRVLKSCFAQSSQPSLRFHTNKISEVVARKITKTSRWANRCRSRLTSCYKAFFSIQHHITYGEDARICDKRDRGQHALCVRMGGLRLIVSGSLSIFVSNILDWASTNVFTNLMRIASDLVWCLGEYLWTSRNHLASMIRVLVASSLIELRGVHELCRCFDQHKNDAD